MVSTHNDAMSQCRDAHRLNVVGRRVVAAACRSMGASRRRKLQRGPRGQSQFDFGVAAAGLGEVDKI